MLNPKRSFKLLVVTFNPFLLIHPVAVSKAVCGGKLLTLSMTKNLSAIITTTTMTQKKAFSIYIGAEDL